MNQLRPKGSCEKRKVSTVTHAPAHQYNSAFMNRNVTILHTNLNINRYSGDRMETGIDGDKETKKLAPNKAANIRVIDLDRSAAEHLTHLLRRRSRRFFEISKTTRLNRLSAA